MAKASCKSKNSFLSISLLIVATVLVCGLGYLWIERASITSSLLSNATGLSVKVDDVRPRSNGVDLYGLRVVNLPKSTFVSAFSAQSVRVTIPFLQLLWSPLVIDEIQLNNVEIGLELLSWDRQKNNWSDVIQRLSVPATRQQSTSSSRPVVVQHFEANKIRVRLKDGLIRRQPTYLPVVNRIELNQIGTHQSLSFKQIVSLILQAILSART